MFYGKDAFEGLRTMDTLMDGKRSGDARSRRSAARPAAASCRRARASAPRRRSRSPPRSDVAIDVPVFTPPFLGSRVAKGISLDEIAAYINETALFRNQWQFRPEKGGDETDDEFKARIRPTLRAQLDIAPQGRAARPRGRVGLLPGERRGRRRSSCGRTTPRTRSGCASTSRASARRRSSASADFFRPRRLGRARLRRLPRRDDGRSARAIARRSCSPRTSTRTTCCCTGCRSR